MGWLRNPRTTREKRDALAVDPRFIRRKRSVHNLPSSWDDLFKSRHRSWKAYRQFQHRLTHHV